jgi:hypothetical protein
MSGERMVPISETDPDHVNAAQSNWVAATFLWQTGVKEKSGQTPTVPEPVVEEAAPVPPVEPAPRTDATIQQEIDDLMAQLSQATTPAERSDINRKIQKLGAERRSRLKEAVLGKVRQFQGYRQEQAGQVRQRAQEILGK